MTSGRPDIHTSAHASASEQQSYRQCPRTAVGLPPSLLLCRMKPRILRVVTRRARKKRRQEPWTGVMLDNTTRTKGTQTMYVPNRTSTTMEIASLSYGRKHSVSLHQGEGAD